MTKTTAEKDGWCAHKFEVSVEHNPYDERRQSASNAEWTAGWCARFGAIKHGRLDEIESDYEDLW